MSKTLLLALMLILPLPSYAQSSDVPSRTIEEAALQKAMADAREKTARISHDMGASPTRAPQSTPMVSNEKLKSTKGIDPAQIARQYADMGRRPDEPTEDLMVFVSLSMPINTLKLLGEQAHRSHAILVLRGIKGGLSRENYTKTLAQLKPVVMTGAAIQINPNLFKRFSVQSVPTFVLTGHHEEGCVGDSCALDSTSVQGDVSLDYALEHFAKRNDALGQIAQERLNKMKATTK